MKFRALAGLFAAVLALGIRTAAQAPAGARPSAESPTRLSQVELEAYSYARTLIDWTPREIKAAPQLGELRFTDDQAKLPLILRSVCERASEMIAEFRNIACQEHMYSEWTVGSPIATYREMGPHEVAHHFQYIILPRQPGDPLMF